MTRARLAGAVAAVFTMLLLQATLVGPLTLPVPASLPALVVAAVALQDGPGTGIPFGFAAGLIADLGSEHPAGVLAATWLGIGLLAGLCRAATRSPSRSVRRDAALAALLCAIAAAAQGGLLILLHADGATLAATVDHVVPTALLDALLALVVVPIVRFFLSTPALRAPRPVLLLGADR